MTAALARDRKGRAGGAGGSASSREVLERRKRVTAMIAVGVVAGMVGLAYASVPLYRLFCQVTGYGGTTQVADAAPAQPGERIIKVRFNADVARDLPWRFRPAQRDVTVRVGEETLAYYVASNPTDKPVAGQASFNVTPQKAGIYFNKIECFCFQEQTLAPGQQVDMPVSFFIDPEIADDPNMNDVKTITLSYIFFHRESDAEKGRSKTTAVRRIAPERDVN